MARRKATLSIHDSEIAITHGSPVALASVELVYDYSQIDPRWSEEIKNSALEIKRRAGNVSKNMISIGSILIDAKEKLPHGQFGDWLEVEFSMTAQWARKLMSASRAYGNRPELHDAPFSILAELSSKSAQTEAVKQIETRIESGETVPVREVKQILKESRQREKGVRPRSEAIPAPAYAEEIEADYVVEAEKLYKVCPSCNDGSCGRCKQLFVVEV